MIDSIEPDHESSDRKRMAVVEYANGDLYRGHFREGKQTGYGILRCHKDKASDSAGNGNGEDEDTDKDEDFDIFEGYWENGVLRPEEGAVQEKQKPVVGWLGRLLGRG